MGDATTVKISKRIVTPVGRVSFPAVFKPRINPKNPTADPKYEITMLFRVVADPKKPEEAVVDLKPLLLAAKGAAAAEYGSDETKWPKLAFPFRKGEEKVEMEGYGKGIIFVRAWSYIAPTVWDEHKTDVIDPKVFYPGCFAVASITPFTWENTGNKGVSFNLNSVMKMKDGKMLGGGGSDPDTDFAAIPLPSGAVAAAVETSGGIEDLFS